MMDSITPIPEEGDNLLDKEAAASPNKNKKRDLNFGFDILKLDQNIAEKATRLMESEFQNHVGPAGKRKKRQQQKEEEKKAKEAAEKEAAEAVGKAEMIENSTGSESPKSPTLLNNLHSPKGQGMF